MLAVLERLSLKQRAILVMHEIDGERPAQIAESLGLPLNTVYSRLRVARKHFAKVVSDLQHEGAGRNSRSA